MSKELNRLAGEVDRLLKESQTVEAIAKVLPLNKCQLQKILHKRKKRIEAKKEFPWVLSNIPNQFFMEEADGSEEIEDGDTHIESEGNSEETEEGRDLPEHSGKSKGGSGYSIEDK